MRNKLFSSLALLLILAVTITTPALAFENREGDKIVIGADETVDDDLYLFANEAVVDGTIKGDLVFFGSILTLNGTVEGDLIAAGQAIVINGTVADDVRAGAAAIQLGEKAQIGDDLIFGGASLENKVGSTVGGDLAFGSAQGLLAGDVTGDVKAGTGGFELRGSVGGDVQAYVDVTEDSEDAPPPGMYSGMFMPDMPITIPSVPTGLTIAVDAKIGGKLEYTSTKDLPVPSGVVAGGIKRILPEIDAKMVVKEPTTAEIAGAWFLGLLRKVVTLLVLGLLFAWLVPAFVRQLGEKIQTKPWPSLGWGVVAYAAFFFVVVLVLVAMILLAIFFGTLTLGGLGAAIFFSGLLVLFALILGFALVTAYLVSIVAGQLLGKLIFKAFKSDLSEHRVWPMILGVVLIAILVALPVVGILVKILVVLFGLGALWLWGREKLARPVVG